MQDYINFIERQVYPIRSIFYLVWLLTVQHKMLLI